MNLYIKPVSCKNVFYVCTNVFYVRMQTIFFLQKWTIKLNWIELNWIEYIRQNDARFSFFVDIRENIVN